jgi:threonine aldolase
MLEAMKAAQTGDDVYGEDPTVNLLESRAAALCGKDAALFVSSGTQSNLIALLSHCQRGEEYIAGQEAHTYRFEAGGGAVLGGIQPQPIPFNARGELPLDDVAAAVKPDDFHFARTRLVCLENTQGGKVLSMEYLRGMSEFVGKRGLQLHLDGARAFNAAVKLGINIREICDLFDTVSICLSKGLGAPVGSVLLGNTALISRARRWRKMLGGGMRQAGLIAAGGLFAIDNNVDRLAEDHLRATRLAEHLDSLSSIQLQALPETNMVMLDMPDETIDSLKSWLAANDVTISGPRLVTHLDVDDAALARVMDLFTRFDNGERA